MCSSHRGKPGEAAGAPHPLHRHVKTVPANSQCDRSKPSQSKEDARGCAFLYEGGWSVHVEGVIRSWDRSWVWFMTYPNRRAATKTHQWSHPHPPPPVLRGGWEKTGVCACILVCWGLVGTVCTSHPSVPIQGFVSLKKKHNRHPPSPHQPPADSNY